MAAVSRLGVLGWAKNKKKIEKAYRDLKDKIPSSEEAFYKIITSFAKSKLTTALFNHAEQISTVDDEAQEVAVYVWSKLKSFEGDETDFYSWLNRICYTQGAAAVNGSKRQASKRVEISVPEEEGSDVMEDNQEIYSVGKVEFLHNGKKIFREPIPQFARELPEFIKGTDLKICMYIREGHDYERIGEILEIGENAVKQRVKIMRKKIEDMKNA